MATLRIAPGMIVSDPGIMRGAPCFAGTGVPVGVFFEHLAEGMRLDDILVSYPTLSRDAAVSALQAASDYLRFSATHAAHPADSVFEGASCMTCEGRRHLLSAPGMLNVTEMAEQLGVGVQEVIQRTQERKLLALPHPDSRHQLYYPQWQLAPEVLPHLPHVLDLLNESSPWACYRFLTEDNRLLHSETPVQALMAGDLKAVMTVARIAAENQR